MLQDLQLSFTVLGAEFISPLTVLSRKQLGAKGYLFDWDGVFNGGHKASTNAGSTYSEPDAMGINMLRFSSWLRNDKMPMIGIVTGELNPAAFSLAMRDHYDFVFFKINHKALALDWLNQNRGLPDYSLAMVMDDVLDLSIANRVNLRCLINRPASQLFKELIRSREYADYITGCDGANHGVREVCELLIGLNGNFTETMERRVKFVGEYSKFLDQRNQVTTRFLTSGPMGIEELTLQQVQSLVG